MEWFGKGRKCFHQELCPSCQALPFRLFPVIWKAYLITTTICFLSVCVTVPCPQEYQHQQCTVCPRQETSKSVPQQSRCMHGHESKATRAYGTIQAILANLASRLGSLITARARLPVPRSQSTRLRLVLPHMSPSSILHQAQAKGTATVFLGEHATHGSVG